jgi:MFS family permease
VTQATARPRIQATFQRWVETIRAHRAMTAIAVATAIVMMGQGVISPVLPLYLKELDATVASAGIVVGAFGLARMFLNVPAGLLGEKYGRTALMSAGLGITALGTAMTGLAGSIGMMIVWRTVAGAGSAMFMTGAQAYVADISTPDNRARLMSVQQGSLLFGTDLGPILGGLAGDNLGLRWPFYIAGALGAIAAVWTAVRLPNRPPRREGLDRPPAGERGKPKEKPRGAFAGLLTDQTFLMVGLFTFVVFLTRSGSRQTLIPWLGNADFGMSATQIGFLQSMMTTITFALILPAGWASDKLGRKPVMVPGMIVMAAGLFLFAQAGSMVLMFAAGALMGLGQGISGPSPAAYVADLAPPGRISASMGLYRTFGDVGLVLGPWGLGIIADRSSLGSALVVNAVIAAGVAVALAVIAREPPARRKSAGLRGGGGG